MTSSNFVNYRIIAFDDTNQFLTKAHKDSLSILAMEVIN